MVGKKVWENPSILILGVEETQNSGNGVPWGPCLNSKHKGHFGELRPMTPGHGYAFEIS